MKEGRKVISCIQTTDCEGLHTSSIASPTSSGKGTIFNINPAKQVFKGMETAKCTNRLATSEVFGIIRIVVPKLLRNDS